MTAQTPSPLVLPRPAPPVPETIIVTGAGRGIGRAVAIDMARSSSASLILVSRTVSCAAAAAACNELRPACARALRWDLADWGAGEPALDRILTESAAPLALVHAAGILGPTGAFLDSDVAAWWHAVEVNLGATIRLTHAVLQRMRSDGAGRVVLFAGGGASYGYPQFSSYGAAKAALVRFTETVAMELGSSGPLITIVAPGANDPELAAEVRRTGGSVNTTVSVEERCRLVRRLLVEDTRGLHGRLIDVRDAWDPRSAASLGEDMWRLRRTQ